MSEAGEDMWDRVNTAGESITVLFTVACYGSAEKKQYY